MVDYFLNHPKRTNHFYNHDSVLFYFVETSDICKCYILYDREFHIIFYYIMYRSYYITTPRYKSSPKRQEAIKCMEDILKSPW